MQSRFNADRTRRSGASLPWRGSLFGKVTAFLLAAVALAYVSGAATGWLMLERSQREEWRRQAEMNAQVASSALRSIYTFVTVDLAGSGQIMRIISDRMIGDDQSVLDTGFIPADVLALASIQTKNAVWLFRYEATDQTFYSIAESSGAEQDLPLLDPGAVRSNSLGRIFTGFATIGDEESFIAFLRIETSDGKLLGAVAASIGTADQLLATRSAFYRNSLMLLAIIMLATGATIVLVMRHIFRPVPALIDALKRIARDDTGTVTPFRRRKDEIGQLASAIETLREAVVEREHLRKVRETAAQMEHLAHHDPLTGLPNRSYLQKALLAALAEIAADGTALNVILFDLDRFKPVNDTYGHAVGDEVLIMTSERVRSLIGDNDVLARLGGDEFALIQRLPVNTRSGQRLARRILEAVAQPYRIGDLTLEIGTSIGIASAPAHGNNPAILFNNADLALYASKDAGRGTYSVFQAGMTMPSSARATLEAELVQALAQEQFEVHYQPIMDLRSGTTSGYEALVRWRHPDKGLVPPGLFISVAEECGLIADLDRWVMKRACMTAARWDNGQTVAVNVSAMEMRQEDLPQRIRGALDASGLPPHRLEIELTESLLLDHAQALPTMNAIRAMGVGIAVDDFGTGYATLAYLADLPFTRIKLDRRFVSAIETSSDCRSIVTSTISLAHQLGMKTTAEGVETRGQVELLKVFGCNSAQGYYFGRPKMMPITTNPALPQAAAAAIR
jgi:diguanylate cyclase (GGDEF)-like protein